jgi:RNA polymerase sigma factor (sigma-70 family)
MMRNPTTLAFQPTTGELYAGVQERDGLGDNLPPDYVTRVEKSAFYGWPYSSWRSWRSAAMSRSTRRCATMRIPASGRTGSSTKALSTKNPDLRRTRNPTTARRRLPKALSVLNARERRIFEARRLAEDPSTLEDLASEFGISRERVRQIGVRTFEKVQKSVKERIVVMETPAPPPAH